MTNDKRLTTNFSKILIANRGEIACRVIKTARRMGIATVAVYSDADANAQHVKLADQAVALGGTVARDSYLVMDKIIAAAKQTGAQAIHPGYGFLSENAEFAELCAKNNIVFIGPPPAAIRAMGSKSAAKALMEKAGVPVVPGYHGDKQDIKHLQSVAEKIGYPVLLKAVAGGGGKGMRRIDAPADFADAFAGAAREAQNSFGNAVMLLEKYVADPRHIEIQVFADSHGNYLYLFERDCSIQRRHQKVVEEAPAPGMTAAIRQKMGEAAVAAARAVNYVGAGTVEFIADQAGNFYFMEMNTRLQVEHPVTEMITGVDLVEWQIRTAMGEAITTKQSDLRVNGHSIEVRLYAEDPAREFLPAIGKLRHLQFPSPSTNVRIDTGVITGDTITPYYDPMIAKIVVWGETRAAAIAHMQTALRETEVSGLVTNLHFLRQIMGHPIFASGKLSTHFIAENRAALSPVLSTTQWDHAYVMAALAELPAANHPAAVGWRLSGVGQSSVYFYRDDAVLRVTVAFTAPTWTVMIGDRALTVAQYRRDDSSRSAVIDGQPISAKIIPTDAGCDVIIDGITFAIPTLRLGEGGDAATGSSGSLKSPMPGKVVQVLVTAKQSVTIGQPLLVIEAMKMEHTIKAPKAGVVTDVFYKSGDQVADGVELLAIG
jgi:3-methylcrotonyl-CoA carboxylase alpha subunit